VKFGLATGARRHLAITLSIIDTRGPSAILAWITWAYREVAIASDTEAPHAARVSAATALLDRAWGKPAQQLSADINAAQTVTINLGWLKGRTVGGFIEHDEDSQARGE